MTAYSAIHTRERDTRTAQLRLADFVSWGAALVAVLVIVIFDGFPALAGVVVFSAEPGLPFRSVVVLVNEIADTDHPFLSQGTRRIRGHLIDSDSETVHTAFDLDRKRYLRESELNIVWESKFVDEFKNSASDLCDVSGRNTRINIAECDRYLAFSHVRRSAEINAIYNNLRPMRGNELFARDIKTTFGEPSLHRCNSSGFSNRRHYSAVLQTGCDSENNCEESNCESGKGSNLLIASVRNVEQFTDEQRTEGGTFILIWFVGICSVGFLYGLILYLAGRRHYKEADEQHPNEGTYT